MNKNKQTILRSNSKPSISSTSGSIKMPIIQSQIDKRDKLFESSAKLIESAKSMASLESSVNQTNALQKNEFVPEYLKDKFINTQVNIDSKPSKTNDKSTIKPQIKQEIKTQNDKNSIMSTLNSINKSSADKKLDILQNTIVKNVKELDSKIKVLHEEYLENLDKETINSNENFSLKEVLPLKYELLNIKSKQLILSTKLEIYENLLFTTKTHLEGDINLNIKKLKELYQQHNYLFNNFLGCKFSSGNKDDSLDFSLQKKLNERNSKVLNSIDETIIDSIKEINLFISSKTPNQTDKLTKETAFSFDLDKVYSLKTSLIKSVKKIMNFYTFSKDLSVNFNAILRICDTKSNESSAPTEDNLNESIVLKAKESINNLLSNSDLHSVLESILKNNLKEKSKSVKDDLKKLILPNKIISNNTVKTLLFKTDQLLGFYESETEINSFYFAFIQQYIGQLKSKLEKKDTEIRLTLANFLNTTDFNFLKEILYIISNHLEVVNSAILTGNQHLIINSEKALIAMFIQYSSKFQLLAHNLDSLSTKYMTFAVKSNLIK